MKNLLKVLLFCLVLTPFATQAQGSWTVYLNQMPTKTYEGHKFKFHLLAKVEAEDDSTAVRLFARVDLKNKRPGFFEDMWVRPLKNNEWKSYTIEGTIDSNGAALVWGLVPQFNGNFYFDDVKIDIEIEKNKWRTVFSDSFGKDTFQFRLSEYYEKLPKIFKPEIIKDSATGNGILRIVGKNVPNFGINNKVGKYADVNGIKLYYEIYGEGQPLVVLHGNGGSISGASSHYAELIKKYKVIAIDSRAQGRSSDTNKELTYELMASDINELLNQLRIDSTFIWGHSDGAILGLIMALNHPKKVKKVLAFAANIVPDSTGIMPSIYRVIEKESKNGKSEKDRKLATLMWKHPNIPIEQLRKIQAEILIMSGDRDFVPLAHTLAIFKHIPNAHLCIIPGATHGAAWEKKELFLQLLTDFFEKPFTMPNTEDWFRE